MRKIRNITGFKRFPYNALALINPANWWLEFKYDNQRKNRGWSDRDTWGGGEYISEITYGILNYLENVQNVLDWEHYFNTNYNDNYGYKSLSEVAQDIDNYLAWEQISFSEPILTEYKNHFETRLAIEHQLYSDYKNAMHFVAENIGALWW